MTHRSNRATRRKIEAMIREGRDDNITKIVMSETVEDEATMKAVESKLPDAHTIVTKGLVETLLDTTIEVADREAEKYVEIIVRRSFQSKGTETLVLDVLKDRVKAIAESETICFQEQIREKVRWLLLTELEPRVREIVERAVANAVSAVRAELGIK